MHPHQTLNQIASQTYRGSCHCGALSFRFLLPPGTKLLLCNCSICTMKGFEHVIVPKENFTLLSGAEHITRYTFNTHIAVHQFCRVCGIHAFYSPRSHPDSVDVNARCVDGLREQLDVVYFDGQNWEKNIDHIQS